MDQVAYMMNGWWAVTKYDPDAAAVAKAKQQTILTMRYLTNPETYFRLSSVNGTPITQGRGGDQPVDVTFGQNVVASGLTLSQSGLAAPFICQAADTILGTNTYFVNSTTNVGTLQPAQVYAAMYESLDDAVLSVVDSAVDWINHSNNLPPVLEDF